MANKKYELMKDDTIKAGGKTLYRIKAKKAFKFGPVGKDRFADTVNAGEEGGYIESEKNLAHDGNCWVMGDAMVYDAAKVYGNAVVAGEAMVYGKAVVFEDALVQDNAKVYGTAGVYGTSTVMNNAKVYGDSGVEDSTVGDEAKIYDKAEVVSSEIGNDAEICGKAIIIHSEIFDGVHKNRNDIQDDDGDANAWL